MIVAPVLAGTAVLRGALGRLLVLAAALALLGHGGVELAPRLVAAGLSVAAGPGATATAGRVVTPRPAAESQPVTPATTLRAALVVPLGTSGADPVARPGPAPFVAPHLGSTALIGRATTSDVGSAVAVTSGRAPPATAGT